MLIGVSSLVSLVVVIAVPHSHLVRCVLNSVTLCLSYQPIRALAGNGVFWDGTAGSMEGFRLVLRGRGWTCVFIR